MSIFKNDTPMPASDDPMVVRTAQTWPEARRNLTPVVLPDSDRSVKHVERPRRGHDV